MLSNCSLNSSLTIHQIMHLKSNEDRFRRDGSTPPDQREPRQDQRSARSDENNSKIAYDIKVNDICRSDHMISNMTRSRVSTEGTHPRFRNKRLGYKAIFLSSYLSTPQMELTSVQKDDNRANIMRPVDLKVLITLIITVAIVLTESFLLEILLNKSHINTIILSRRIPPHGLQH
jgi:hypothetical protein